MVLCLSDRILCNLIRTLENLDPAVTPAEINQTPDYFHRLLAYLRDGYGLEVQQGTAQINHQTGIGHFRVILQTDDIEKIAEGLQLLQPLNVTIEREDLGPLNCPLAVPHWAALQPHLQRLSLPVSNLLDKINDAMFAVQPQEWTPDSQSYESWAVENNVPIPPISEYEARQQRNAEMAEARAKADEARRVDHTSSWKVQDLDTGKWY